jgi:hypothetical protein
MDFGCFESVSSKYIKTLTKKRATRKIWRKVKKGKKTPAPIKKRPEARPYGF